MRRRVVFALIGISVLIGAASIRIRGIRRWSLNNDEIAEMSWASLPFRDMMREAARDKVHPPLDYIVHFAIERAGAPEWVHRVPSAACGIATVALVMILGFLWEGEAAGVAAGLFLAIAPMHVRYSQEVRPYSMAIFFLCASLVALELYARKRRIGWAVAWFVLVWLAGSTLYFAGLIAVATSIFRIAVDRRGALEPLWSRFPLIVLAWAILYAPWLPIVMRLVEERRPFAPEKLSWPWWRLRLQTLATGDVRWEDVTLGSWTFWACVALGAVVAVRRRMLWIAAFWFFVGTALQIFILHVRPHYSAPRYLMSSWPAAFILAGAAIAWLLRWNAGRAVVPFVLLLFGGYATLTLQAYFRGSERSEWRDVAEYVHERARPGESVIVTNNWAQRNFGYYWERLPARPGVWVLRFEPELVPRTGPLWIVTGQCWPREPIRKAGLMHRWEMTEMAEVRYLRAGETLSMTDELCPE